MDQKSPCGRHFEDPRKVLNDSGGNASTLERIHKIGRLLPANGPGQQFVKLQTDGAPDPYYSDNEGQTRPPEFQESHKAPQIGGPYRLPEELPLPVPYEIRLHTAQCWDVMSLSFEESCLPPASLYPGLASDAIAASNSETSTRLPCPVLSRLMIASSIPSLR